MNNSFKALLCAAFSLMCFVTLIGQDIIFQMVTLTPKPGVDKELASVMKEHNDLYHKAGDYGVRVYSINSGPDAGKIVWTMGPTTWTKLEGRPGTGVHDDHWDQKVTPLLESEVNVEYFSFSPDLSYFPKDFDLKNLLIRYVDVKSNEMYRYNALIEKAKEVYTKKLPNEVFGIYKNQLGDSKDGRDVMIVWFFDSLSWMDEDNQFPMKYEEVHGPGSWVLFQREVEATVKSRNDILVSYRDDMGGSGKRIVVAQRQPGQ
jgi:hypothetical protein